MSVKSPDAFRTISEVAEDLDLPQHVLRFWETRFTQIKPLKRGGGRRYYRPEDVDLLNGIRLLLYGEGFTIKGVQRLLKEKGVRFVIAVGQSGNVETVAPAEADFDTERPSDEAPARAEPIREEAQDEDDELQPSLLREEAEEPVSRRVDPHGRERLQAVLSDLLEARRILHDAISG
nr:MerR family transcriptional regulator [Afifella aestuarii]